MDRLGIQKSEISSNREFWILVWIVLVLKWKQGDFREGVYHVQEDKQKVVFLR